MASHNEHNRVVSPQQSDPHNHQQPSNFNSCERQSQPTTLETTIIGVVGGDISSRDIENAQIILTNLSQSLVPSSASSSSSCSAASTSTSHTPHPPSLLRPLLDSPRGAKNLTKNPSATRDISSSSGVMTGLFTDCLIWVDYSGEGRYNFQEKLESYRKSQTLPVLLKIHRF